MALSLRRQALLAVLALTLSAVPAQAQEPVAMLSVHGNIEAADVFVRAQQRWMPAFETSPALLAGDSVRVGAGAEAVLLYRDGRSQALSAGSSAGIGAPADESRSGLARLAGTARGAIGALFDLVARDADGPAPTRLVAMQSRGSGTVGPRLLLAAPPHVTPVLMGTPLRWDGRVWGDIPVRVRTTDESCDAQGDAVLDLETSERQVVLEDWAAPGAYYRITVHSPAGAEASSACFRISSAEQEALIAESRVAIRQAYTEDTPDSPCPVAPLATAAMLAEAGFAYDAALTLSPLVQNGQCPLAAHLQRVIATAAELPHAAP
jgi:hypothetical protein